jgi:GAF domain-containing protein
MESFVAAQLSHLKRKIASYGKENLEDILHVLIEAVTLITRQRRCRIYLEDLTGGILVCAAANGLQSQVIREQSFPLNTPDYLVSRVYMTQEESQVEDVSSLENSFARDIADRFSICASYLLPLVHQGRSVGVLCVDSSRIGHLPTESQGRALKNFLEDVVSIIDQARKYHQQMVLARRVDRAKKKRGGVSDGTIGGALD